MKVSANFAFLKQEFPHAAESASYAERHVYGDPRASCFHARHALERLVKRVYRVEKALSPPKGDEPGRLPYAETSLSERSCPRSCGRRRSTSGKRATSQCTATGRLSPEHALNVVRELAHVLYWAGRTYLRKGAKDLQGKTFDESLVPKLELRTPRRRASRSSIRSSANWTRPTMRAGNSKASWRRCANGSPPSRPRTRAVHRDPRLEREHKTRRLIIDLDLQRAGWPLDRERDREYEVTGMPNASGVGYADYVLWGDDGKPLAVVEAKRTTAEPAKGRQQAKLYADCLEAMHGQRPIIYYTNGYETHSVGRPNLRATARRRFPQEGRVGVAAPSSDATVKPWTSLRSRTPSSSATTRSGPSGASASSSRRRGARHCW